MLTEGFRPNGFTFLGVLVACTKAKLVEEGLCRSLVDLLIRAGQLEKALRFIAKMPVTTYTRADLACRSGHQEAKCWMLSNTYASADIWSDPIKVRHWMEDTQA
jgi:hypothetical protein